MRKTLIAISAAILLTACAGPAIAASENTVARIAPPPTAEQLTREQMIIIIYGGTKTELSGLKPPPRKSLSLWQRILGSVWGGGCSGHGCKNN